jgi:hypothetical protein
VTTAADRISANIAAALERYEREVPGAVYSPDLLALDIERIATGPAIEKYFSDELYEDHLVYDRERQSQVKPVSLFEPMSQYAGGETRYPQRSCTEVGIFGAGHCDSAFDESDPTSPAWNNPDFLLYCANYQNLAEFTKLQLYLAQEADSNVLDGASANVQHFFHKAVLPPSAGSTSDEEAQSELLGAIMENFEKASSGALHTALKTKQYDLCRSRRPTSFFAATDEKCSVTTSDTFGHFRPLGLKGYAVHRHFWHFFQFDQ